MGALCSSPRNDEVCVSGGGVLDLLPACLAMTRAECADFAFQVVQQDRRPQQRSTLNLIASLSLTATCSSGNRHHDLAAKLACDDEAATRGQARRVLGDARGRTG